MHRPLSMRGQAVTAARSASLTWTFSSLAIHTRCHSVCLAFNAALKIASLNSFVLTRCLDPCHIALTFPTFIVHLEFQATPLHLTSFCAPNKFFADAFFIISAQQSIQAVDGKVGSHFLSSLLYFNTPHFCDCHARNGARVCIKVTLNPGFHQSR